MQQGLFNFKIILNNALKQTNKNLKTFKENKRNNKFRGRLFGTTC